MAEEDLISTKMVIKDHAVAKKWSTTISRDLHSIGCELGLYPALIRLAFAGLGKQETIKHGLTELFNQRISKVDNLFVGFQPTSVRWNLKDDAHHVIGGIRNITWT
jgi:hypothetical protein